MEPTLEPLPVEETTTSAVPATKSKRSPSDFLKSVLGRPVRVKLNSGTEYRGKYATRYQVPLYRESYKPR